jgi:sugar phosphate permease
VGIYLCRDNFSVANPLLQKAFHASKADVGTVATVGTLGYMLGKFASGPLADRIGGRPGYLAALAGVALFGALGGFAPGLGALALLYALNRFWGAGGWNSITKLMASWFPPGRFATALALVSLSYVFGGMIAVFVAQQIVAGGGGWRAVMSLPAVPLLLLLVACAFIIRAGPLTVTPAAEAGGGATECGIDGGRRVADGTRHTEADPSVVRRPSSVVPILHSAFRTSALRLLRRPQFQTLCILSFTLTLLREGFKTWKVDFLASLHPGHASVAAAALESIGFDAAGALPVLLMGLTFDRIRPEARRWVVAGLLLLLAVVVALLAAVGKGQVVPAVVLLALVGLLIYGPYSILAGVIAVEAGGTALAATAAGITDGIGYLAALTAGRPLGLILDRGGYPLSFKLLAVLTAFSALIALRLRAEPPVVLQAQQS